MHAILSESKNFQWFPVDRRINQIIKRPEGRFFIPNERQGEANNARGAMKEVVFGSSICTIKDLAVDTQLRSTNVN